MTEQTSIEWEAIRRNWPIIVTICACVAFGFQMYATIRANEAEIKALQDTVSVQGIIEYQTWRVRTDMRLDRLEEGK